MTPPQKTARNMILTDALDKIEEAPGQAGIGVRPNRIAVPDETWNRITTAGTNKRSACQPSQTYLQL